MLACLQIENLNNRLSEITNLLAFYTPTYLAPTPSKTERRSPQDLSEAVPVMPDEIPACPHCEITDESVYIDLEVDEMTVKANQYVKELLAEFRTIGVEPRIGIADSRFVSSVAAHSADPHIPCVVPQDKTESFLSSQSVSLLPILPATLRRLKQLGIQTFGDVASVSSCDLINQFGKEGALMADLARGIDFTPLNFYKPPITEDLTDRQERIWGDEVQSGTRLKPVSIMVKKIGYIDFPQAILRHRKWVYFDSIIDLWKLESDWWTEHPQSSIYFKLFVSGRELTVCHDLARGNWSQY